MSENYVGRSPGPQAFPAFANQAEMELAAALDRIVAPGTQKFHAGMAKAWVEFNGTNGAILASYNVASVVRNSLGVYDITFAVPFSSANYACCASADASGAGNGTAAGKDSAASTAALARLTVSCGASNGKVDSVRVSASFFGDQ